MHIGPSSFMENPTHIDLPQQDVVSFKVIHIEYMFNVLEKL